MTFGTVTPFGKAPMSGFSVGTTAVAADYTTVTENGIKYNVYADHAEVAKQDSKTISGKVVIPAAIKTTNGNIAVTSIGENGIYKCPNLIISGFADFYAETYAKANNIPFKYLEGTPSTTTTAASTTSPKTQPTTGASTNPSITTSASTTRTDALPTTESTSANTTTHTTSASGANPSKITYGDANNDGKVSVADATAILQYLANRDKFTLSEEGKKNADCYNPGDGVTANDVLAIQKLDAKCIDSLPYNE